jgi:hypothetical protein
MLNKPLISRLGTFEITHVCRGGTVMGKINPIRLRGPWKDGYAIDYHTISSEYLGTDEWGHERFETTRSDIGQLVYDLKYRGNLAKADDIIPLISPFLNNWGITDKIDLIMPIPPSKKERTFQPVNEISKRISRSLNKPILLDIIQKIV